MTSASAYDEVTTRVAAGQGSATRLTSWVTALMLYAGMGALMSPLQANDWSRVIAAAGVLIGVGVLLVAGYRTEFSVGRSGSLSREAIAGAALWVPISVIHWLVVRAIAPAPTAQVRPATSGMLWAALLVFFALPTIGAVVEELLFRGAAMRTLAGRIGVPGALMLTSALFGAVHVTARHGWVYALYMTGIGGALGLVRLWRRGLAAVVVIHVLLNTATQVLLGVRVQ